MPNTSAIAVLTPGRLLAALAAAFIVVGLIDGLSNLDNHNAPPSLNATAEACAATQ